MSELTQRGIAALQSGNKALARQLLDQATLEEPDDSQAWLWLAGAVDSDRERGECLRQVLRIDPSNDLARRGLASLEKSASSGISPARKLSQITAQPFTSSSPAPTPPPASPTPDLNDLRAVFQAPLVEAPPSQVINLPGPVSAGKVFSHEAGSDQSASDLRDLREALPAAIPPVEKGPRKNAWNSKKTLWIAGGITAVIILLALAMGIYLFKQLSPAVGQTPQPGPIAQAPGQAAAPSATPSRTPQPSETPTFTPTVKPSATPIPTETLVPLGATARVQSEWIIAQVSELRGLKASKAVPLYILTRDRLEKQLRASFFNQDTLQQLEKDRIALAALGLISPGYDLTGATLNSLVDNVGGFYVPASGEIFLLGLRFGGVEHYVYSHEIDHALVDQNFATGPAFASELCKTNGDACQAVDALIEGDASLVMYQWWKQFANTADARDILMYRPPLMALPLQAAPPFLAEDINFPYEKGMEFIKYLYGIGRWPRIDKAYAAPPLTTEQILHPRKYTAGEAAIAVEAPPLDQALGQGWQLAKSDVLGEWKTYLLLAFNANPAAQVEETRAAAAAAGWGGDHYQVYYQPDQQVSALAAQWAWDTSQDAADFYAALGAQLNARYQGQPAQRLPGECWAASGQISCAYIKGSQTLWLLAPDFETLDQMLAQYPAFQ